MLLTLYIAGPWLSSHLLYGNLSRLPLEAITNKLEANNSEEKKEMVVALPDFRR